MEFIQKSNSRKNDYFTKIQANERKTGLFTAADLKYVMLKNYWKNSYSQFKILFIAYFFALKALFQFEVHDRQLSYSFYKVFSV